MPRNLSPAALAQTLAGQLRPALFLRIRFLTDTVLVWNGLGPITATGPAYSPASSFPYGQAFTGMGWMGTIRAVPQVSDIVATNITLELSGIPVELMTDAIHAVRQNSVATLWLGFLNTDGSPSVIVDPEQIFEGSLDVPTTVDGAATCSLAITCENPLIDLNRAPNRRFTDIDQQLDYPGDTGFFQVQLLQDFNVVWPYATGSQTTPSPPNFLIISPGKNAPVAIAIGGTQPLTCIETRSDGTTQDVTLLGGSWWSSDDSVATVDSNTGVVTGVGQGMCNIVKRFVQGMFRGSSSSDQPSGLVQAAVTMVVTI